MYSLSAVSSAAVSSPAALGVSFSSVSSFAGFSHSFYAKSILKVTDIQREVYIFINSTDIRDQNCMQSTDICERCTEKMVCCFTT